MQATCLSNAQRRGHVLTKEVEENLILLVNSGSRAYGTQTALSDKDYKGVMIPGADVYLGLRNETDYNYTTGSDHQKNTHEDVDVNIQALRKFIKQGLKGNINALEVLFVDESDILVKTEAGNRLIASRSLFLSNQLHRSLGGFAFQLKLRLEKELNGEPKQVYPHGYDTKTFMHAVRIYQMGIDAFLTGTFLTKRQNADELLAIRNGFYQSSEAILLLNQLEDSFQHAYQRSVLPEKPSEAMIHQLAIELAEEKLAISKG